MLSKRATVAGFRFGEEEGEEGGGGRFVEYQVCLDGFPCAWRRYSEFDALRLQLVGNSTQLPFPPKRLFKTASVHEERKLGLELWLNGLLRQVDPVWDFDSALALRAFFNSEPWCAVTTQPRRKAPVVEAEPAPPPPPAAPVVRKVDWALVTARLESELADFCAQQQQQADAKEEFDLAAFQAKLREAEALYKL